MDLARLETLGTGLHQEAANALFGPGPHDSEVSDIAVRNPALGAVDHPVVTIAPGPCRHAAGVRAKFRLGQAETPDHFALRHERQPALLLLLGPVAMDREHTERTLDRNEAAQPAVATLQLLAGEAIHDVAHPRGAIAMQMHAEDAQFGQLGHDLHREGRPFVVLGDDGKESLVDEATHRRADESLLLGQQVIGAIEIHQLRQGEPILRLRNARPLSWEWRAWKTRSRCGISTCETSARCCRSSASSRWRSWASSSPTRSSPPPVRRPTPPLAATRS